VTALEALVGPETAGDPMSAEKWVRSSLRHLSRRLGESGHPASRPTVKRLLVTQGYALHVNDKQGEASAHHPERDTQFVQLTAQRRVFAEAGLPIISVDTKKKELVGNFKNAGRGWRRVAERVNVHDFPSDALGHAVPYGIYDLTHNRGTVYVGTSADTPRFAVDVIARWWAEAGQVSFPQATRLLILADAGGSNGCRPRLWKRQLQEALSDAFGLDVTVGHYPTGCSKYNPIEHRLFGPISLNWAGQPLRTWDAILSLLRGTATTTGLAVHAYLHDHPYPTGERVSDADMKTLNLHRHVVCPTWNYTIRPRCTRLRHPHPEPPNRELIS